MKRPEHIDCQDCTVRQDSLLSKLCHNDLKTLDLHKTCNVYKKGQVIFYEGNRPSGLFCVNTGKIKIYKMSQGGKEQIVRLSKPGDFLGYRSLLGEECYSATAEALEDSRICFIDKKDFYEVLNHNHDFSFSLIQSLCEELRDAEDAIRRTAQKPVRERLAEVLLILKRKFGEKSADKSLIGVTLTREDLANYIGTATETVIRLLSDFKDEKIIAFEGKAIRISNEPALLEAANLDY